MLPPPVQVHHNMLVGTQLLVCKLMRADTATARLPWQDVQKPVEQRIQALMSNMTIDEKIGQLSSNSPAIEHLDIPAFNWWTGNP